MLQDDVIRHVTGAMAVRLTDVEENQIDRIPTDNLEAYDFYLRAEQEGAYFGDLDSFRKALFLYQRAIEIDPTFTDPYAGIARIAVDVWRNDYNNLWSNAVARKIAYDAAGQSLDLDPGNARAHSMLALLQLVDGRTAEAHANLGFVLALSGHADAAVTVIETALRPDPTPTPNLQLLAGVVYYAARDCTASIARLKPAADALPDAEPAHEYLAADYADRGDEKNARREVQRLLELFPAANLNYYRYHYDYWDTGELRHHLDDLEKAGLPSWPFGVEGRDEDRLDEEELEALTRAKAWTGRHRNGTRFVQQVDQAGNVAYQSADIFTTGTAYLDSSMLCQRVDGAVLDRAICGYVYRNASEPRQAGEAYVQVSPDALKYFSLKP